MTARQAHEARKERARARAAKLEAARAAAAAAEAAAAGLVEERGALAEEKEILSASVADKEKALRRLKARYAAKLDAVKREASEAVDEAVAERDRLAATLREQSREMRLLEQLALLFLTPSELGRVWERADWSDERDAWLLPQIRPRPGWKARPAGPGGEDSGVSGAYVAGDDGEGQQHDDGGSGSYGGYGAGGTAAANGSRPSNGSAGLPMLPRSPALGQGAGPFSPV